MIYCDMDGVLVDFEGAYLERYGKHPKDISKAEMWEYINSHLDYWSDLPKMKDADELLDFLSNYEFRILTGLPHSGYEKASVEKKKWVEAYLGHDMAVICCLSADKQKHGNEKDILIDDRADIIKRWNEMGGIGILHKSAKQTIKELTILLEI